jgi:alkanesulfonate monooxygenase SsuD/methylene tetrahydromethanopterin reductase-like flavin-dependent oxidoreductase (luciferase family)
MPLMLAVIGGEPQRFAPYVELYRRALEQMERPILPVGMHSQGFVAATDAEARETFYPAFKARRDTIGRERGWPPLTPSQFDQEIEHGSLYVGSPETVAGKIARATTALGVDRFDLVYSSGPIDERARMASVELYGSRVLPLVQELTAQDAA